MKADIAQALLQAQRTPVPPPDVPVNPTAAPPQNPFALNQALEQQATPQNGPMHPIVAAIMQHLGLLNMIRNQSNAGLVAGDQP